MQKLLQRELNNPFWQKKHFTESFVKKFTGFSPFCSEKIIAAEPAVLFSGKVLPGDHKGRSLKNIQKML
jgi:hypothetical protein